MERYKKLLGADWSSTSNIGEVQAKTRAKILREAGLMAGESVRFAAFTDQLGLRGSCFVLVTDRRLVTKRRAPFKSKPSVEQVFFGDISAVSRDTDNLTLQVDGKKLHLFSGSGTERPSKPLCDAIFNVVNSRWRVAKEQPGKQGVELVEPPSPELAWSDAANGAANNAQPTRRAHVEPAAAGETREPWYRRGWVIALAIVLFAPAGVLLLWTGGKGTKNTRIGLTAVASVWFLFVLVGAAMDKAEEPGTSSKQELPPAATKLPSYRILDERVSDTPVKTQVEIRLLVTGRPVSRTNLEALLRELHKGTKARTGFKHHKHPTAVYIYAFGAEGQGGDGWIAMLQESHVESAPSIRINDDRVARVDAPPEERLGLSEQERRELFVKIVACEDNAMERSEQKIPRDLDRQIALHRKLDQKCKRALAKRYRLDEDGLTSIAGEGVSAGWAMK